MSTPTAIPPQRKMPPRTRRPRVAEVDWLRTMIVLAIVPYHVAILFSAASPSVLRHTYSNALLPLIFGCLQVWGIALLFLLAGASSRFALDVMPVTRYLKERVLRLLVPLVVVVVAFAPLRAYFLLLSNPSLVPACPRPLAHPELLHQIGPFFQQYLTCLLTVGWPIVIGNPLAYLWFIPRLLFMTVVCVPLFLYLRQRWPRRLSHIAASRVLLATLLIAGGFVAAAVVAILQPGWLQRLTTGIPLNEDWMTFALDGTMYIFGWLIYSSVSLRASIRALAFGTLGLALACWGIVLGVRILEYTPPNTLSLANVLFGLAQGFAIWLLILATLGLGMRYLTMLPAWLQYLNTAAFPVFILHVPILTVAAYYLQALPVPWYVLLLLIFVVTVAGTFAIYEFVLRRVPVIGMLFGLSSRRAVKKSDT